MGGCGRRSDRIGGWSRAQPAAVRVSLHGSPASVITHCCGLGLGVGVLGGFRAGVDGLCRLCCVVAVGGPFADGLPSVFQPSQLLLVRWGDTWGCCGWRATVWASSGRAKLQQACGFTAL